MNASCKNQQQDIVDLFPAIVSTFSLAFFWYIGAIPAGTALGMPPLLAALVAWSSYMSGVVLMLLIGAPLRSALVKRFKISTEPDESQWFWRVWKRYGLIGLGLFAPVTVGSQAAALIALALRAAPLPLLISMALGAALWSAVIALLTQFGVSVVR